MAHPLPRKRPNIPVGDLCNPGHQLGWPTGPCHKCRLQVLLGYSCAIDVLGDGAVAVDHDATVEIVDSEWDKAVVAMAKAEQGGSRFGVVED